jgi:phosphatidylglycerophosphate synthase
METLQDQETVDRQFFELVAPLMKLTSEESEEVKNGWQVVAEATNYIVTPANAIDVVGFAASMYGIYNLDSWKGIIAAGSGFMTDVIDGKVARKTKTASPLGEAIDAGGDKVKLAFALLQIWRLDLAPKSLVLAIAAQNAANVGLTAVDQVVNKDEPVMHPSKLGKRAIFIEQWGLGIHVIGSEVAKNNDKRGRYIKAAGSVIGYAGVILGVGSTAGYTSTLVSSSKSKKGK